MTSQWTGAESLWHQVLSSNTSSKLSSTGKFFSGTYKDPTTVNFVALRSMKNVSKLLKNTLPELGIQLSYSGTTRKTSALKNLGTHSVAFRFVVPDNVYVVELVEKVFFQTQIGTLFSLALSVFSVMRVLKMLSQLGIDNYVKSRAKYKKKDLPSDVLHRSNVLGESNIQHARRRISAMGKTMERISSTSSTRNIEMTELGLSNRGASAFGSGGKDTVNPAYNARGGDSGRANATSYFDAEEAGTVKTQIETLKAEMEVQIATIRTCHEEELQQLRATVRALQDHIGRENVHVRL